MVRDHRHDSVHLFGAICPARAIGAAIIMPSVNTEAMNEHLIEISTMVAPDSHAILVCDGAGWHQPGERLCVPENLTLLRLPPYAPELNPMENVWAYSLRQCWRVGSCRCPRISDDRFELDGDFARLPLCLGCVLGS